MTAHVTIHAGDTRPINGVLEDELGPIEIQLTDTVRFVMWAGWAIPGSEAEPIFDEPAEVVAYPTGEVRYSWVVPQTDTPGRFRAVFRKLDDQPTPQQLSFPSDRYMLIEILP